MTDQTDPATPATPELADAPEEPPEAVADHDPEETDDPALVKVRREAARYRTKLRDAETERDALAARVETMRRAEVERLATGPGRLHDGADLWRDHELATFLDDDGNLDPAQVDAAVATIREQSPHLARPDLPSLRSRPTEALRGGTDPTAAHTATWGEALAR